MITLITGLPGNGKTLYALTAVAAQAKREGRAVYYHGINGLSDALGWFKLDTQDEHLNGASNPTSAVPAWWKVPAKSIVLVDEAQMCGFGVRAKGQMPEWAQKLETHRHLGIDVYLITQDPSLIDSHDRKLCELHFHVMRTFGMQRAVVHEFRPVRPNALTSRKGSIEHIWKYPREVYGWYVSAEAHTVKRRVPMKLILLCMLPLLIGALSYFAWTKYLSPNRDTLKQQVGTNQTQVFNPSVPGAGGAAPANAKMSATAYVEQFAARVPGLAYTAPAYDDVTKPVAAPYPAACVASSTVCRCYTQQGTRLVTPEELCKGIVAGGFFVAWDKPADRQQLTRAPEQKVAQAEPPSGPRTLGEREPRIDLQSPAKGAVAPDTAGRRGGALPRVNASTGS